VDQVIVGDNGSTDDTVSIATGAGATVTVTQNRGYGSACMAALDQIEQTDVVVFLDGDYADDPRGMDTLVDPIVQDRSEIVIGSRVLGERESGALTPQARMGNWLACHLIHFFWGARFTDLGPFRAIRFDTLQRLKMQDPDFGWTVEMQIKAAMLSVRCLEVPVSYRKRIGKSKISGTVKGVYLAGKKILGTIYRYRFTRMRARWCIQERLVIFSKYPVSGKSKTRMIPELGAEGAAGLQREMTEHVVRQARELRKWRPLEIEVRFTGGTLGEMQNWLGRDVRYTEQGTGNLGERMHRAMSTGISDGMERVVIVGADIPTARLSDWHQAFSALGHKDVVLGPATDGGYYLIGMTRSERRVFEEVAWGSEAVMATTRQRIAESGLNHAELTPRDDIDRPEDLDAWRSVKGTRDTIRTDGVSVIVPTFNECETVVGTVRQIESMGIPAEVVVVDGGSQDGTCQRLEETSARVIPGRPPRGAQCQLGATHARFSNLLFLHADTQLPADALERVMRFVKQDGNGLGAFRFAIPARGWGYRWIEFWTHVRVWMWRLPYGDQGLFMRADVFWAMNGFRSLPIMDDFDLVVRVRKFGKIVVDSETAPTSPRRWIKRGKLRTTFWNQVMVWGWFAGIKPETLARWYRGNGKNFPADRQTSSQNQ
jgi:rSAM/selenodomain-associated transferase 2/rSAM/selenodomain-associated transferase 1